MYDDLVKRLRESADWADHFAVLMGRDGDVASPIKREAADAIEELSAKFVAEHELRVKALNRLCSWCGVCSKENRDAVGCDDIAQLDEVNAPRWISVEEALPEENGRYLVRYKRDIVLDYTEVHDDEARIMRFFVCDGWRYPFLCQPELRKAEQQTVTHWMALPNLPAEENANG